MNKQSKMAGKIVAAFKYSKHHDKWKVREELVLLDAVEHFGYGNWEDPCKALDNSKATDVKQHFEDYFIQGNIGKATWNKEPLYTAKDHTTVKKAGPLLPGIPGKSSETDTNFEKTDLGYMPRRDDFEWEYENGAENLISTLTLSNDDEDVDTELKMVQIDMYHRVLKERKQRKQVVVDHNLVSQFYSQENRQKTPNGKKKSARDDKDLREKFQPFAQFQSSAEIEQHTESVKKERDLKIRIKELSRYRRNGITKLKECSDFDSARYKRDRKKENCRKKPSKDGCVVGDEEEVSYYDENDSETSIRKIESNAGLRTSNCSKLLSNAEKKLCSSMGLKPAYYIAFKTYCLKDHLLRTRSNFSRIPIPCGLGKDNRNKILKFFVQSGWVSAS
ncbi:Transcriptional adapter 2-beta [Nymphon striatum]|nr:Transcriptional adapter 2-beta [Nymphon striatum]